MTEKNSAQMIETALLAAQEECKRLRKDNTKLANKVRKIESGCWDEFYTYSTLKVELPPGGSATQVITLTREADFYLTKLVRTGKDFSFQIADSSNDRRWSNILIDAEAGAGTASLPLILPKPRFVARASKITIEFVNNLKTKTNVVSLALIGYKVYHVENLYYATGS